MSSLRGSKEGLAPMVITTLTPNGSARVDLREIAGFYEVVFLRRRSTLLLSTTSLIIHCRRRSSMT